MSREKDDDKRDEMAPEEAGEKRSPGEILDLIDEVAAADASMRALDAASPGEIDERLAAAGLTDAAEKVRRPGSVGATASAPRPASPSADEPGKVVALRQAGASSRTRAPLGAALAMAAALVIGVGLAYRAMQPDGSVAHPRPEDDDGSVSDAAAADASDVSDAAASDASRAAPNPR